MGVQGLRLAVSNRLLDNPNTFVFEFKLIDVRSDLDRVQRCWNRGTDNRGEHK